MTLHHRKFDTLLFVMKKNSKPRSSTETGHNVDIPQRNPRSVENGQEALPTSPRHAGARTPRREVVRDAEGFQSVRVRRSPRHTDAEDEEGHFVPEAPARRPKATKRKAGFECLLSSHTSSKSSDSTHGMSQSQDRIH